MKSYLLEFTRREYTTYSTYVKANSPQDAMIRFLAEPEAFNLEEEGVSGYDPEHAPTGVCGETLQVIGVSCRLIKPISYEETTRRSPKE